MYVDDMMQILGLRLEDADNIHFSNSFKRDILELSQIKLSNMLDNGYLTELEYIDTEKTATSKELDISEPHADRLTYHVLKGREGILKVKIHDDKYCTPIDIFGLKRTENVYLEGTDENPLYYVFQNKIYILCTATSPVIDIYYLKYPTPLLYPLKYDKLSGSITGVVGPVFTTYTTSTDHNLYTGDVVQHTGFSDSAYNGEKTLSSTPSPTTYITDDSYSSTGTGSFEGLRTVTIQSGQNISNCSKALFYNISKDSYHVITAYNSGNIVFKPAIVDAADNETIYLLKNPTKAVELTNLENLEPDLNVSLHELIIDMAEAECWKSGKKGANVSRMATIIGDVFEQIQNLNEKVKVI